MANKQEAAILLINDVPVAYTLRRGADAGEPIMRMFDELIRIAGGKLVCRNHMFGKETGEEEVFCSSEDCYGYISDHEGLYGLYGHLYDTNGRLIKADILYPQSYAELYPEFKDAVEKYCIENNLVRPNDPIEY